MPNQPTLRTLTLGFFLLIFQITFGSTHSEQGLLVSIPTTQDTIQNLKNLAIRAAENNDAEAASTYIDEYVRKSLDISFVKNSSFRNISENPSFQRIQNQYLPRLQWGYSIYIYAGLIGFFIVLMFNVQKKKDWVANLLLSSFIFIHSFFIIHVGLHSMKYSLQMPHLYSASTIFSFLYGPLLFFYFKRIKTGYTFKKIDFLHLVPTLFLFAIFIPVYILPEEEKLKIMLGVSKYQDRPYGVEIALGKMISLLIYGYFTVRLFLQSRKKINNPDYEPIYRWQRNIVLFQTAYTLIYTVYWILLILNVFASFMFHMQLIILSTLVLYVAYIAYVNPKTLLGFQLEESFLKYKNSGLTQSYSLELKDTMLKLFEDEKIFNQNDVNLDYLAERLGTTRHSTSQIINEHFNLNFFELINHYRIKEATKILTEDPSRNIIDVAYEVGYNNRVTFNKSFKKENEVTPSQFKNALKKK